MNHQSDFLFVLLSRESEDLLKKSCQKKGFAFEFATTLKEAYQLISEKSFKVILVDISNDAITGLQFLEWLSHQSLMAQSGIFFQKGYEASVTKAFSLGIQNAIHLNLLDSESDLLKKLEIAIEKFDLYKKTHWIELESSLFAQKHFTWVSSSDSSQKLWQDVVTNSKTSDAFFLWGPDGVGKSYLLKMAALLYAPKHIQSLVAKKTTGHEQRDEFLAQMASFSGWDKQVWIIENIENLHFDLQELVAELLKGQGWQREAETVWPYVKVLFASESSLDVLFEKEKIREDLYYFLLPHQKEVSSLKERREDILGLTHHFLKKHSSKDQFLAFGQDVLDVFKSYDWPGEVVELENLLKTLCKNHSQTWLKAQDLPQDLLAQSFYKSYEGEKELWELPYQEAKKRALHKFHKVYMEHLLEISDQNYTVAAEKAGMDRSNFKKLLKKV